MVLGVCLLLESDSYLVLYTLYQLIVTYNLEYFIAVGDGSPIIDGPVSPKQSLQNLNKNNSTHSENADETGAVGVDSIGKLEK